MILVDSSIWIDHLRSHDARLDALLRAGRVGMHSLLIGELACGSLKDREAVLEEWQALPRLESVSDETAMMFIQKNRLMGCGIGFVDVHLLASVKQVKGARLWSRDKRLAAIAAELRLAFNANDA
jgi:predicted nucleic acid-binding protein